MAETSTEMTIRKLRDGGYLISDCAGHGYAVQYLFACTKIEVALNYIKEKLEPSEK